MFDRDSITKRYFSVPMGDSTIEVEPPKVSDYKKILQIMSNNVTEVYEACSQAVLIALSANKQNTKITAAMIDKEYNTDEIKVLIGMYMLWINETEKSPN